MEHKDGTKIEKEPDVLRSVMNSDGTPIRLSESFKDIDNYYPEVWVLCLKGIRHKIEKIRDKCKE